MKIEEVKDYLLNLNLPIKKIVFSDRLNGDFSKIVLRPVEIKGQNMFQVESFKGAQAFHAIWLMKMRLKALILTILSKFWLRRRASQFRFQFQKAALKRKSEQTT